MSCSMRAVSLICFLSGRVRLVGDAEVAAELGHVAGRLDVVERVRDLALLVDDEGRADDALDGLAVELLLTPGAVGGVDREVLVAQQRDGEVVVLAELRELGRLVLGDPDDLVAVPAERLEGLAEVARLLGAAGGHRRGVEVDDDLAAGEVREAHRLSSVVGEAERRGLLAGLELRGHRCSLLVGACRSCGWLVPRLARVAQDECVSRIVSVGLVPTSGACPARRARARPRSPGWSGAAAGADGGTRTRTPRAQEPKSCVSTSSTTSARGVRAPTVVATPAYHGPRLRLRPEEVLDETCSRRCLVDGPNGAGGPAIDTTTCPQCGAVAEVTERAVLESTAGPVEHVRVVCLDRHWFLLPAESVTSATAAGRTGRLPAASRAKR